MTTKTHPRLALATPQQGTSEIPSAVEGIRSMTTAEFQEQMRIRRSRTTREHEESQAASAKERAKAAAARLRNPAV